jgi:hypothetical protein
MSDEPQPAADDDADGLAASIESTYEDLDEGFDPVEVLESLKHADKSGRVTIDKKIAFDLSIAPDRIAEIIATAIDKGLLRSLGSTGVSIPDLAQLDKRRDHIREKNELPCGFESLRRVSVAIEGDDVVIRRALPAGSGILVTDEISPGETPLVADWQSDAEAAMQFDELHKALQGC